MSDLHTEFDRGGPEFVPPKVDCDVVVLAGDIGLGSKGVEWAARHFPDKPVIYILGNHEYYKDSYPDLVERLQKATETTQIHVLENGSWTPAEALSGWRILGCTLWTDFKVTGNAELAMFDAQMGMEDYRSIRVAPRYRRLRPLDTLAAHRESLSWLEDELGGWECRNVIVVTHHLPSLSSIDPKYTGTPLNPAFASNLDDLIDRYRPALWIHGHTHRACDYRMPGGTRVVCNPKGYPTETMNGFDPRLVITAGE